MSYAEQAKALPNLPTDALLEVVTVSYDTMRPAPEMYSEELGRRGTGGALALIAHISHEKDPGWPLAFYAISDLKEYSGVNLCDPEERDPLIRIHLSAHDHLDGHRDHSVVQHSVYGRSPESHIRGVLEARCHGPG